MQRSLSRLIAFSLLTCCTSHFDTIQPTHFLIRGPSFIAGAFHYWTYCGIPLRLPIDFGIKYIKMIVGLTKLISLQVGVFLG